MKKSNNVFIRPTTTETQKKEKVGIGSGKAVSPKLPWPRAQHLWLMRGHFPRDENKCTFPCLAREWMNAEILKTPRFILQNSQSRQVRCWRKLICQKNFRERKIGNWSGLSSSETYGLKIQAAMVLGFSAGSSVPWSPASNPVQWRVLISWG